MALPNLRQFTRAASDPTITNGTSLTHLPTTLLDTFIPGYSLISAYILETFAFDISLIVSCILLIILAGTGGRFALAYLSKFFFSIFATSITIYSHDPLYDYIIDWCAAQASLRKVRNLKGNSAGESFDDDGTDDLKALSVEMSDDSIFNFNNWSSSAPPRYFPNTGFHLFFHNRRPFWFATEKDRVPGGFMGMMIQDQERVTLTTIGRSTVPIKSLILTTRDLHLSLQTSKTVIRRPSPKEQRGRGRSAWNKVAVRPSRPMSTVVLDAVQKAAVLRDINDFLHPRTPRWYANRGIPYRRGYLFHGPPGTGKTSLSFALAGVFGLDIYCLSLSEATLTEEDLITLFNSLPRRCVVLLEDIDSAGVLRKKGEDDEKEREKEQGKGKGRGGKKDDKSDEQKDSTAADSTAAAAAAIAKAVAQAVKGANDASESNRRGPSLNNQGISMSGLLNAIDGVASQEGRVLVMTTNHPHKLDDALVRPGRVDMMIEFALANRQQSRELFVRMYEMEEKDASWRKGAPRVLSDILPDLAEHEVATEPEAGPISKDSSIKELAAAFADALPEGLFSPAEIQGFLLTQKKDPYKAVVDVVGWRDAELSKKHKSGIAAEGEASPKTDDQGRMVNGVGGEHE